MTQIFEIGTKVKYDATEYGGGFFTGIIHGHYTNGGELYYVVVLDKKYRTMVNLKGFENEFDSRMFLADVVCHSGFIFELKE